MRWPRLRRPRIADEEIAARLQAEVDRLEKATRELEAYVRDLRETTGE